MSSAVWRLLWAIWRDFNTGKHPRVYIYMYIYIYIYIYVYIVNVLTTTTIVLILTKSVL